MDLTKHRFAWLARHWARRSLIIWLLLAVGAGGSTSPPTAAAAEAMPFPSVAKLIDMARAQAPQVVTARAAYEAGKARRVGAKLLPLANPYLEVFADRGLQGATKDVAIAANLWLPIEMSAQRRKRLAEAEAFVAWQRSNIAAAGAAAVGEAVVQYGEAVVADARLRIFGEIAELARQQATIFAQRLQRGDATRQDTALAETELARVVVTLDESRADLTRALAQLAALLGQAVLPPSEPRRELPPAPPGIDAVELQRTALASPLLVPFSHEATYYAASSERARREAHDAVNLILSAGRGDLGEQRWGGGLSWTFPFLRRGQGEQAVLLAGKGLALATRDVQLRVIRATLEGLYREWAEVAAAVQRLDAQGMPAARAAVSAAMETLQAGKGEFLLVLTAQRDRSALEIRRLELIRREWSIVSDVVGLTGEMPP